MPGGGAEEGTNHRGGGEGSHGGVTRWAGLSVGVAKGRVHGWSVAHPGGGACAGGGVSSGAGLRPEPEDGAAQPRPGPSALLGPG